MGQQAMSLISQQPEARRRVITTATAVSCSRGVLQAPAKLIISVNSRDSLVIETNLPTPDQEMRLSLVTCHPCQPRLSVLRSYNCLSREQRLEGSVQNRKWWCANSHVPVPFCRCAMPSGCSWVTQVHLNSEPSSLLPGSSPTPLSSN